MRGRLRKIQSNGTIRLDGAVFSHPMLKRYIGQKVIVRYEGYWQQRIIALCGGLHVTCVATIETDTGDAL